MEKFFVVFFLSVLLICNLCSCSFDSSGQINTNIVANQNAETLESNDNNTVIIGQIKNDKSETNNEISKTTFNIEDCVITVNDLIFGSQYTKPEITVSYNDEILKENKDYTITVDNDLSAVGKYTALITMKDNLQSKSVDYYVRPQNTAFTAFSSKVSSISLSWLDKSDMIDGYEIQYTDTSFSGNHHSSFETTETSLSLDELSHNSIYYFTIRTYKTVSSEKIYSDWSKLLKIPLKKIEVINGVTFIDDILIVNKTYSIPSDYGNGEDPTALTAFQKMADDAFNDGLSLYIVSGYRSYATQTYTYNYFCNERGQEQADRVSARPGHSEHQTGLAFDINSTSFAFTDTPEAKWLAENCYKYGFIIRYPEDKEDITGYAYESWHIRYVGKKLATELTQSGLTVEEYFGITSKFDE